MKFLLLTTGGTIASVASKQGFVPALSGEKLLEACPLLMGFEHDLEIVDVFSKDSSNMHPQDWLTLEETIRRAGDCDAVVVLHGTDTLAWTSAALSYLLQDVAAPVVLTGSMLPPGEPDSDAPENIYAAFQFALQLALYKRRGVAVAFADTLFHGPRVTKLDSRRKKAFASVDYPLLGEMKDKGGHKVAWLTPHSPNFSGRRLWDTPRFETDIALVPIFPGMKPSRLEAVLASGPKAVVLEAYGLGGVPYMHESFLEPIARGITSGVPIVLRTQSAFGGTDLSVYEVGTKVLDLGALSAGDMTREALMVKLMLLLPRLQEKKSETDLGKELATGLSANLCDDITDTVNAGVQGRW
ncbi:MAG: asparaginase [Synergistaceae bacterium]|jgi:L-asparaginase|nr:asparaginase [Synergistaceae bacterium]